MPNPKRPKLCKLCQANPATVPDRYATTRRPILAICQDCHAERLKDDLKRIADQWRKAR
jgi:hypothetical protein